MQLAEQMKLLSEEPRLHFCEGLSHNLTIVIRAIWSDNSISDKEKVDRIKWVNEILHRVSARIWQLRLKTDEWTEIDFENMIHGFIFHNQAIKADVLWAVQRSYEAAGGTR